jgi:hypothetical protein
MHVRLWNEGFVSLHRAHEGVAEDKAAQRTSFALCISVSSKLLIDRLGSKANIGAPPIYVRVRFVPEADI